MPYQPYITICGQYVRTTSLNRDQMIYNSRAIEKVKHKVSGVIYNATC